MTVLDEPVVREAPFKPLPGAQTDFMRDTRHRYIAMIGGKGAGKSVTGAQKLVETHIWNTGFIPNEPFKPKWIRSLCVAPSYQMLQTVNVPQIVAAFDRIGLECRPILDPKKLMIVVPQLANTEILLRSADSPEKINGFEVGCCWCDESSLYGWSETDTLTDALVQADHRIRGDNILIKQLFCTYTPEGTATRMFRDFETGFWMDGDVRRVGKRDHVLYRARTDDNPYVGDYAKTLRSQYSPELAKQYLDGITMESSAGRVFSSFDEDRNIDAELALDPYLPLQIGVDFNVSMHAVVGQYFPGSSDRPAMMTSVYEISDKNMTIPQMITAISTLAKNIGWEWTRPLEVYGDPAGHARMGGRGESQWDTLIGYLRAQSIPFQLIVGRSHTPVADRVAHSNAALFNAEGQVRWKINPRCEGLLKDLKFLTWKPDGTIDKRDEERSHFAEGDSNRCYQQIPINKITFPTTGRVFTA